MKQHDEFKVHQSVGIAERKSPPLLTGVLTLLLITVYSFFQSAHGQSWIMRNTFQAEQIVNIFNTQKYEQIGNLLFMTNFANISIWQLLVSIYFICLLILTMT